MKILVSFLYLAIAQNDSKRDCYCNVELNECDCCCDNDCSAAELQTLVCEAEESEVLSSLLAKDNSPYLGVFYSDNEFDDIGKMFDKNSQKIDTNTPACGGNYCRGGEIFRKDGDATGNDI